MLVLASNKIAVLQEVLGLAKTAQRCFENTSDSNEVQKFLFGILQQGPDDRWSGRGNDLKREIFDEVRDYTRDVISLYR